MRWILLIAGLLALMGCDKEFKKKATVSCIAAASNDLNCSSLKVVKDSVVQNRRVVTMKLYGCGRSIWYEYGEWCEDCDRACRRAGSSKNLPPKKSEND